MPSRMFACFDQPDLKAAFDSRPCTAPGALAGRTRRRRSPAGAQRDGDNAVRTFCDRLPRMSHRPRRPGGRPRAARGGTSTVDELRRPTRSGVFCRASLAQLPGRRGRLCCRNQAGLRRLRPPQLRGPPIAFGKYDQLFVPGVQRRGAMENAGASPSARTTSSAARLPTPAYERRAETILHETAHVVRRPGHHALVGRPVAQRVLRRVRLRALPGEPPARRRGPPSNQRKPGRTGRISCPSPIRSPPHVDLDRAVGFDGITYAKGASALRQLVAWVGEEEFLAGLRQSSPSIWWKSAHRPADRAWRPPPDATRPPGRSSGCRPAGVNLLRPIVEVAADGTLRPVARPSRSRRDRPAGLPPVLRLPSDRDRHLRLRRRRSAPARARSRSTSPAAPPRSAS
jgi:aminopeptidase N